MSGVQNTMGLKDFKLQGEQMIYSTSKTNYNRVFYHEGRVKRKVLGCAMEQKVRAELLST